MVVDRKRTGAASGADERRKLPRQRDAVVIQPLGMGVGKSRVL